jgi:hypothetical protein
LTTCFISVRGELVELRTCTLRQAHGERKIKHAALTAKTPFFHSGTIKGEMAMAQLEFTDEEQQVLKELLEEDLSDLRMEVSNTHNVEFRETLKHKEQVLKAILERL